MIASYQYRGRGRWVDCDECWRAIAPRVPAAETQFGGWSKSLSKTPMLDEIKASMNYELLSALIALSEKDRRGQNRFI